MTFSFYESSLPFDGDKYSISHNILHSHIQDYIKFKNVVQPYYLIRDSGTVLSLFLYCGNRIDVNYG